LILCRSNFFVAHGNRPLADCLRGRAAFAAGRRRGLSLDRKSR
jgi:hypothetical protein